MLTPPGDDRPAPEFHAEEADRRRREQERPAPHLEAAMKRKTWRTPPAESETPEVRADGRGAVS